MPPVQLRRLDGCSEFQPTAGSSLVWPLGPSHPSPRPAFTANSRDALDFPHLPSLPSTGLGGTARYTLDQVPQPLGQLAIPVRKRFSES